MEGAKRGTKSQTVEGWDKSAVEGKGGRLGWCSKRIPMRAGWRGVWVNHNAPCIQIWCNVECFEQDFKSQRHTGKEKIREKRCSYSRKRSPKWRWAAGGKVDQWRGWLRERRKRQECVCRNPDLPRLLRGEGEEKKEEEREGVESITVDPVERIEPCVQIIDMI